MIISWIILTLELINKYIEWYHSFFFVCNMKNKSSIEIWEISKFIVWENYKLNKIQNNISIYQHYIFKKFIMINNVKEIFFFDFKKHVLKIVLWKAIKKIHNHFLYLIFFARSKNLVKKKENISLYSCIILIKSKIICSKNESFYIFFTDYLNSQKIFTLHKILLIYQNCK